MRALVVMIVAPIFGCGHAPPPKAVAPEKPVNSVADVAGHWVTSDDMDWYYAMAIEPSGAIDVVIDRNKMGRCEQKGKLAPIEPKGTYQITFEKNECNHDYAGAALQMKIASFTGASLTIAISGYGSEERHVYSRDPKF